MPVADADAETNQGPRIDPEPWRHFCPANLLRMNHDKSGYLECIEINIDVWQIRYFSFPYLARTFYG